MQTKWEYLQLYADNVDLNKEGSEGWELVCFHECYFLFKRPLQEQMGAIDDD